MQTLIPLITDVAESIPYDNGDGCLQAENVQDAIDEVNQNCILYLADTIETGNGLSVSEVKPLIAYDGLTPQFLKIEVA